MPSWLNEYCLVLLITPRAVSWHVCDQTRRILLSGLNAAPNTRGFVNRPLPNTDRMGRKADRRWGLRWGVAVRLKSPALTGIKCELGGEEEPPLPPKKSHL